jgi:hypothetical protein
MTHRVILTDSRGSSLNGPRQSWRAQPLPAPPARCAGAARAGAPTGLSS